MATPWTVDATRKKILVNWGDTLVSSRSLSRRCWCSQRVCDNLKTPPPVALYFVDYRCVDGWFSMSTEDCQVPTSTSQNLNLERKIWISGITNHQYLLCIWSKLTRQLVENGILDCLLCANIQQKRQFQRSWGCQLTIQSGLLFECGVDQLVLEQNQEQICNPGVVSYPIMPRNQPNLTIFFPSSHL